MLERRVAEAIADVFGLSPDQVTLESGPDNIEDWDSVGHLKLVLHVEDAFKIRFPTDEISTLTTAARIQDSLRQLKALP